MEEERACQMKGMPNEGERGCQGVWKLPGDQVDESYCKTVEEGNTELAPE